MMEWRTYYWGIQHTAKNEKDETLLKEMYDSMDDIAKRVYSYYDDGNKKENSVILTRVAEDDDGNKIDGLTLEIQR